MPRSIIDTVAVSLEPEIALSYIESQFDTLIVANPAPELVGYTGKLVIHSLGYPPAKGSTPEEDFILVRVRKGCEKILSSYGLTIDQFPGWAIHGWGQVSSVFQYDADRFRQDVQAGRVPTNEDNLLVFTSQQGWRMGSEVWGIRFSRFFTIAPPVVDVLPPDGTDAGDFWYPAGLQLEAFKLALEAEVLTDEEIDVFLEEEGN